MAVKKRYLFQFIKKDLRSKMVFLTGPRQVGKTTLSLSILFQKQANETHPAYLNWDDTTDRKKIKNGQFSAAHKLVILDEVHKYSRWQNMVKGFYDKRKSVHSFLVTGSGRLDIYRKGGDSLQGRYHLYRLHPFSLLELDPKGKKRSLDLLLKRGGFPEALFVSSENDFLKWQNQKKSLLIHNEIRSMENIKDLFLIETLVEELPSRVGSPLSIRSLSEDLEVAHKTVKNWLEILERLYFCFRISPFGPKNIRAVKKEQKLYLFDWAELAESEKQGIQFESLMACQLLKYCHFIEDTQGYKMELRFIRDTDKREIDFVVLKQKKPIFAVECKTKACSIAKTMHYFKKRTSIPKFYQVHLMGVEDYEDNGIRVLPFNIFCKELKLP